MKAKTIIIIVLTILIVIFALQNTESVHVRLWFWSIQIPRALLIFCCLAVGVIIGLMIPSSKKGEVPNT
jgi:uncharacterized integral membrane protein